jgi:hypothetical protein
MFLNERTRAGIKGKEVFVQKIADWRIANPTAANREKRNILFFLIFFILLIER